jgi:hypothetical protein
MTDDFINQIDRVIKLSKELVKNEQAWKNKALQFKTETEQFKTTLSDFLRMCENSPDYVYEWYTKEGSKIRQNAFKLLNIE